MRDPTPDPERSRFAAFDDDYVEPLRVARVLVHVGELQEAQREVAVILDATPDDRAALSLLAKIQHIRGRLSDLVACWAALYAGSSGGNLGRLHLESMLALAQDPARGGGEFLMIGRRELTRKPLAYLELEEAFRLYVARRPDEACERCERVASRYRLSDREVYKLAMLALAWLAALSGEVVRAIDTLERFGRERGFETDRDRVLMLVELYEKLTSPAALLAAVNICRHLERASPDSKVLGRLASLYLRLGDPVRAADYARRHLAAFQLGMHRPDARDLIEVSASRYIPLERLRTSRLAHDALWADAAPREKALGLALGGRSSEARVVFAAGPTLTDRKYAAELALAAGDEDAARAGWTGILRDDPADLQVLWLLLARRAWPAWLGAALADAETAGAIEGALAGALDDEPRDARTWRALATLLELRPIDGERRERAHRRATGLEALSRDNERSIGRVLSLAIHRFVGQIKGLVHEVWAGRELVPAGHGGSLASDKVLGNLSDELRSSVLSTFVVAREYARVTFPELVVDLLDYGYVLKVSKDDEPSHGSSAGLPIAIAFLSVFLQRPVSQRMAFTGAVFSDAHDVFTVRQVGEIQAKVKGVYHRDLDALVLPADNRRELEEGHLVPLAVTQEMCRFVATLDEAVAIAFGADVLTGTTPRASPGSGA